MEDNFVALLSFINEAEKYIKKNTSKDLGELSNINLSKLKKQLAEHISSFDIVNNAPSIEVGKLAFNDYVKSVLKAKNKKKNVIDELGQIFDVNFEDGIDDENKAEETINNILGNEEVETIKEPTVIEEIKVVEEPKVETSKEVKTFIDGENIDEVLQTMKEKVDAAKVEPVQADSIVAEPVKEENEENKEVIREVTKDNDEYIKDTSDEIVKIADETVGKFETDEDEIEDNNEVIEEIKKNYENLEADSSLEQENNFGLAEDDEVLNTIRKAASENENFENNNQETEKLFQPAPDNLDSIFEEVEANKPDEEAKEAEETEIEEIEEPEEIEQDILSSLAGLINYGQFDEKPVEEEVEEEEEPVEEPYAPTEVHYIVNPLIDETDYNVAPNDDKKETDENESAEFEQETPVEEIEEHNDGLPVNTYGLHIIENPGLDVVFDGDDVVYSSYDENSEEKTEDAPIGEEQKHVQEEVPQDEATEQEEVIEEEVKEEPAKPLDENDRYVDSLLTDIEFGGSKVNEILDEREQTYKVISKMYPYLKYAFIKSAFDLKDSIADEYEEGGKIIVLHRGSFEDLEDLRKYAEVMMSHNYQVNVDEAKMIVDSLKSYVNTDGLILNSIFDVANQIALLNGKYEGYCVLTNDDQ